MTNNVKTKKNAFNNGSRRRSLKKKAESVTYCKKFESFDEAAKELCNIPGYINECFGNLLSNDNDISVKDMQESILEMFSNNLPDIESNNNQFWAVNMSFDRCIIKTGKFFAFGWVIDKDYVNGSFDVVNITLTFKSFNPSRTSDEINYLKEHDWYLEEK